MLPPTSVEPGGGAYWSVSPAPTGAVTSLLSSANIGLPGEQFGELAASSFGSSPVRRSTERTRVQYTASEAATQTLVDCPVQTWLWAGRQRPFRAT